MCKSVKSSGNLLNYLSFVFFFVTKLTIRSSYQEKRAFSNEFLQDISFKLSLNLYQSYRKLP